MEEALDADKKQAKIQTVKEKFIEAGADEVILNMGRINVRRFTMIFQESETVEIDITNRSLQLHVSEEELAHRKEDWVPLKKPCKPAFAKYAFIVGSTDKEICFERGPALVDDSKCEKSRTAVRQIIISVSGSGFSIFYR